MNLEDSLEDYWSGAILYGDYKGNLSFCFSHDQKKDLLGIPGGKNHPEEECPLSTAKREVGEEINISLSNISLLKTLTYHRFKNGVKKRVYFSSWVSIEEILENISYLESVSNEIPVILPLHKIPFRKIKEVEKEILASFIFILFKKAIRQRLLSKNYLLDNLVQATFLNFEIPETIQDEIDTQEEEKSGIFSRQALSISYKETEKEVENQMLFQQMRQN